MTDLYNILEQRRYDYDEIWSHEDTIRNLTDEDRDLNVIIGIKGRGEYFRATIRNLIRVIDSTTNYKVKIIVVEQDETPHQLKFCSNLTHVEYVYIPMSACNTENQHSTSLMYNVGFLFAKKSHLYAFHCADTLVEWDFFNILNTYYFNKSFNWIQPYTKKKVVNLSNKTSGNYITGLGDNINPVTLTPEKGDFHITQNKSGAPGGCIIIPRELFIKVGGYEPELFYGYTVEDSFMWCKMEIVNSEGEVDGIHSGMATYADNPKLQLYHLHHPSAQNSNKDFDVMMTYLKRLFNWNHQSQLSYIDFRRGFFNNQITTFDKKRDEEFHIH